MAVRDLFQSISEMDATSIQKIVDRLEFRGNDPSFVEMREAYLDRLAFDGSARVLEIGCGSGVVSRALAKRPGFTGTLVGSDFSEALIEAARRLADEEGVGERIDFRVGDSHGLDDPDGSYDVVLAHTLVSHVVDPEAVISEATRVTRPGGKLVFFDGDYASLVFGAGDATTNAEIATAMLAAIVANPHVMRTLPLLLQAAGLKIDALLPHVLAEVGEASFFASMVGSYVPMAVKAGTIPDEKAGQWLAEQREASANGVFFGSCNFYSYIASKPE
ncbi:MAG: methyltransferase domain-containing protein [Alphaproteobacteria bacterium]